MKVPYLLSTLLVSATYTKEKHQKYVHTVGIADPVYSCPDGYNLEGNQCAKSAFEDMVPTCLEGRLQSNGSCLVVTSPQVVCPAEYVNIGNQCIKTRSAPAQLSCPAGFSFDSIGNDKHHKKGATCVRSHSVPQYGCPPGTHPEGDHCITEISTRAQINCPEGTFTMGMQCAYDEVYDCSPGVYAKHGHGHRALEEVDDDMADAESRELTQTKVKKIKAPHHQAEVHVATIIPSPQRSQCRRTIPVPANAYCEEGILVGRECIIRRETAMVELRPIVSTESAAPVATCPAGFAPCGSSGHGKKKGGAECCFTEDAPSRMVCPYGYTLLGDSCQTTRPAEYVCNNGFQKHHGHGHGHHGSAGGCAQKHYVDPIVTYQTEVVCQGNPCTSAKVKHGHH